MHLIFKEIHSTKNLFTKLHGRTFNNSIFTEDFRQETDKSLEIRNQNLPPPPKREEERERIKEQGS